MPRLSSLVIGYLSLAIASAPALAQTPTTRPAAPAPYTTDLRPDIAKLPTPPLAPRSVEDLKTIQARVEAVVKAVLPATVGLLVEDGQGSGVIVSKDGYILTAGHVSGTPGKDVIVVMPNGQQLPGKTLGMNKGLDSGMVKITAPLRGEGFPFVPVGLSSKLTPGQWVVAMGHPGGYQRARPPVVRLGRVALLQKTKNIVTTLATDCPLIMGDSGGPLFDLDGRLVGINSKIGLGNASNFHVPVDVFTATWKSLASGEEVGAGPKWFARGKKTDDLPPAPEDAPKPRIGLRGEAGLKGLLVTVVTPGTAAEDAGLKEGDLVTAIAGTKVASPEDVSAAISKNKPGDLITLDIQRNGKSQQIKLKLGSE